MCFLVDRMSKNCKNGAKVERKEKDVPRFERAEVLTAKEACELLRISRPTLRNLINKGEISGFKVGNRWRIMKKELERYVKERLTARRSGPETSSATHPPPGTG
jgi:excisionase family DNA binding protein